MQINDRFNPALAEVLKPTRENALTLISRGLGDYAKQKKIDKQLDLAQMWKERDFNLKENIFTHTKEIDSKKDKRADKELDLAQIWKDRDFGLKENMFSHTKEVDNKRETRADKQLNLFDKWKKRDFDLKELDISSGDKYRQKSLNLQQQRINMLKEKAKTSITPINFDELNSNLKNREMTKRIQAKDKNGNIQTITIKG